MAAVAAGQVTRARAFMKRVYDLDRDSKFVVIKERGTLEDVVIPGPRTVVLDVDMGSAPLKGVRRIIWESQHVAGLVSRHEASVYLTFSHFLPPGVTCPVRIVGVSNMAPFSREAIDSDDLGGRLRLRLLRRLIVNSARRASHVIALSGACRDALVGSGVDGRRILVLSNGCDDFLEDLSGTTAAETVAAPHKPYVLCVSHFYPYKNFEVLIEGFALLDATLRERYELVIVGAPMIRKYHQRITRRVAELAGHCRIIILPGRDSIRLPIPGRELPQCPARGNECGAPDGRGEPRSDAGVCWRRGAVLRSALPAGAGALSRQLARGRVAEGTARTTGRGARGSLSLGRPRSRRRRGLQRGVLRGRPTDVKPNCHGTVVVCSCRRFRRHCPRWPATTQEDSGHVR